MEDRHGEGYTENHGHPCGEADGERGCYALRTYTVHGRASFEVKRRSWYMACREEDSRRYEKREAGFAL